MDEQRNDRARTDPVARAAGYALLVACVGWAVLVAALVPISRGPSTGWLSLAVLAGVDLLLAACAVGVLRGSRPAAVTAIVVLAGVTVAGTLLVLPLTAVLVALLGTAYARLRKQDT